MARQSLKLWPETSYGVFANPGSPVKNTAYCVISLDQGNAFSMRPTPVHNNVRTSDGWNRRMKMVAGQTRLAGKISTLLYPEQTPLLMGLATTLSAATDLGSFTVDHQFADVNGTVLYRRYLGCKIANLKLSFSADSPLCRADMDIVAAQPSTITITDFPQPPASDYVSGNPYAFFNMSGGLTINSARTEFREFSATFKNMIDSPFFESQYITRATFCGRDIGFNVKLALKGNTDRLAYEANTAQPVTATLNNGAHTLVMNLESQNFMSSVEDDLSLDHLYYQNLTFENFYDGSATTDFAYTTT